MMPEPVPSICFVAPHNYGVLAARNDLAHIGGAEVQRTLIARALAGRGRSVSFVTLDHGQPDGIEHDQIRVFKMCAKDAGLPFLRYLHPRCTSLWSALGRACADIYYQRTAGVESGQVALWCRRKRKPFVLGIANDPECDRRLGNLPWRERWSYYYALKHADVVVAQTRRQQQMLADNFAVSARLIRNCAPDPFSDGSCTWKPAARRGGNVLWVGRFSAQKRPELLLALARMCPELTFEVAGSANDSTAQSRAIEKQLRALDNTRLHGFVPHERISSIYDCGALLLCTSTHEGFPNTFLEAWSRGIPTVSTVDPDDVIRDYGLGAVAESPTALSEALRSLAQSAQKLRECGSRARRYFLEHHTVDASIASYETLLRDTYEGFGRHPSPQRRAAREPATTPTQRD